MKGLYLISFGGQIQILCLCKEMVKKLSWASFADLYQLDTCIATHSICMIGMFPITLSIQILNALEGNNKNYLHLKKRKSALV